jgi:alkanesulfonate monooxygenase SsuD/methylene tetrahydromethanopterin reductase-like flavin-dependent oxidoreductase (luciferase family)
VRFALELVNFPDVGDPRQVVRFAEAAERAGWDGLFMWDHLGFTWGAPSSDPWICLAAAAARTERLVLGTSVSPIPRYQPQLLATELATLDHLSGGRMVLGAGLGGDEDFAPFGGPEGLRARAALADEALAVIDALWSGEPVSHDGPAYVVRDVTLAPLPVQRPRIPIWVGGMSDAALRRAARWDGWMAAAIAEDGSMTITPDGLGASIARIRSLRDEAGAATGATDTDGAGHAVPRPFGVTIDGQTEPGAAGLDLVASFAAVGATWWLETLHGYRGDIASLMARVEAGPPR